MGGAAVSTGLDLVLARVGGLGGHGGAQQLHLGLGLLLERLELLVGGLVRRLHDGSRHAQGMEAPFAMRTLLSP
eukprot:scaffold106146_cov69-Phaeocystis_antarctica.AAC.2